MKVEVNYGVSPFIVPGKVLECLGEADNVQLSVLLYILSKKDFQVSVASKNLNISEEDLISALSYWQEKDIIKLHSTRLPKISSAAESKAKANVKDEKVSGRQAGLKMSSSLPTYTLKESAKYLETHRDTAELIDQCEEQLGKTFTGAETNIVIGMLDSLSLEREYILLLCAQAKKMDKKNLRYVEKMAIGYYDRGITTYDELVEEFKKDEVVAENSKFIRKLFGMGDRALTEKEKDNIRHWFADWKFSKEAVNKAYEITVNSTGKPSMNYMHSVLENWHSENLKTVSQIDAYIAKFKEENSKGRNSSRTKGKKKPDKISFDTEDMLKDAILRSYGNEKSE